LFKEPFYLRIVDFEAVCDYCVDLHFFDEKAVKVNASFVLENDLVPGPFLKIGVCELIPGVHSSSKKFSLSDFTLAHRICATGGLSIATKLVVTIFMIGFVNANGHLSLLMIAAFDAPKVLELSLLELEVNFVIEVSFGRSSFNPLSG